MERRKNWKMQNTRGRGRINQTPEGGDMVRYVEEGHVGSEPAAADIVGRSKHNANFPKKKGQQCIGYQQQESYKQPPNQSPTELTLIIRRLQEDHENARAEENFPVVGLINQTNVGRQYNDALPIAFHLFD